MRETLQLTVSEKNRMAMELGKATQQVADLQKRCGDSEAAAKKTAAELDVATKRVIALEGMSNNTHSSSLTLCALSLLNFS